ncbi:MAG TPA: hypothetical protein PLU80_02665, partial [Acidobacteriota bacterium]|nr:hypothetical protein [Acidobacteriota bacterium]
LLMLDESPLGKLAELEGEAAVLSGVLAEIDLSPGQGCTSSYIGIQQARCEAAGKPLEDLVFEVLRRSQLKNSSRQR